MPPHLPSLPNLVQNRWLRFLIWQLIFSTSIFLLTSPFPSSLLASLASFLIFLLSVFLFSFSLFLTSSPQSEPSATLSELSGGILRAFIKSLIGGFQSPSFSIEFRRRAGRTMKSVGFILICAVSGGLWVVGMCCDLKGLFLAEISYFGSRGLVLGLLFGIHYVYFKRWVLQFPIVQRPLFFSFKMGLFSAFKQALKLSFSALFGCSLVAILWSERFLREKTFGQIIIHQIRLLICISAISFCWEVSRHLLEVLHTRRCAFTPAQGSVMAESNPNEALLETLEHSSPGSLFQYLAYLDLCLASESDFELWRRVPLFEESGQTYKRVMSLCLRPLEQFTLGLAEALEAYYPDKSAFSPKGQDLREAFDKPQLMTWCARTVSALTSRSHKEDRFGVAQLTNYNSVAVSTLLSCLLAVEFTMGRKPGPAASHVGPISIKWAGTAQSGPPTAGSSRRRDATVQAKAFAMADVLRTAIYQIVSTFEEDMLASAKSSSLLKCWISESKPLYGTREALAQKLSLFLDYRAV